MGAARPSVAPERRTLRSYARKSRPFPAIPSSELALDPILNSDDEQNTEMPAVQVSPVKHLRDISQTRSMTSSPALSPSGDSDHTSSHKNSNSSSTSGAQEPRRITRQAAKAALSSSHCNAELSSSDTAEKQSKKQASSHPFIASRRKSSRTASQNVQTQSISDDDSIEELIETTSRQTPRKRLRKNAPPSDDEVQEVPTSPSNKRRRTRSAAKRDGQLADRSNEDLDLQVILNNANDETEFNDMVKAWGTPEGRLMLRKKYCTDQPDEEDDASSTHRSRRKKKNHVAREDEVQTLSSDSDSVPMPRRKKRPKRKSKLVRNEEESDDEVQELKSSGPKARRKRSAVSTRSQSAATNRATQRVTSSSKSVPLPTLDVLRNQLRSREQLISRNTARIRNAGKKIHSESSSSSDDSPPPRGLRRSKRVRSKKRASSNRRNMSSNNDDSEDDDDARDKDYKNVDDVVKNLSDVDEEPAEEEEEETEELELEEVEESVGSDEDGVEVQEILSKDEEHDDDDDDYESDDTFEDRIVRRRATRRKNGRRRRTRPKDIFKAEGDALSAREQQQRLDFLVHQSANIAQELHKAMAVQTGKRIQGSDANINGDVTTLVEDRKEEELVLPSGQGCELQPHQLDGVKWLLTLDAQGLNAILADEMGLGKTIQAISFLASLVLSGSRGPHLVIAPKNVCEHWVQEVEKFYPNQITAVCHHGNARERLENLEQILEEDAFDIMVTSYDHARNDLFTRKRPEGLSSDHMRVLRAFRKVEFEYLVVDEAHRLNNDNTKTNIGIRGYTQAQRRLLLTGTPLSNNLRELWSLMNVLNPQIFSSKATFETWFAAPFSSKTSGQTKVSLTTAEKSVIVDRLHTVIRPFFRRRVRADVCPSYSSADEVVIRCPMSSLQRALMMHFQKRTTEKDAGINNVIMSMRGVSNHPFVVSHALYDSYMSQVTPKMVASSGKFVFLYYALPRLIASDHRVLIFSQFREVLDFIEDLLELMGMKFCRLDGTTKTDDRRAGLSDFNREGSDIPVFLLTTRAGGVGLNLQTADTVILFDSDWNPSADLQAVSRIQRIGQKKTVHILRLVTEKGVDDLIVETSRHKLKTQKVAVGAGKFNTSHVAALDQRIRQKDLEDLLQRLEATNFAEVDCDDTPDNGAATDGCGSASGNSKQEGKRETAVYKRWYNALLRPGEASLADVSLDPIWVDSVDGTRAADVPAWLKNDADVWAATKALKAQGPFGAQQEYDDAAKSKALIGSYSKKGRAARARRQAISFDQYSDMDPSDDEQDPDIMINEDDLSDDVSEQDMPLVSPMLENVEKHHRSKKGSSLLQAWATSQSNLNIDRQASTSVPISQFQATCAGKGGSGIALKQTQNAAYSGEPKKSPGQSTVLSSKDQRTRFSVQNVSSMAPSLGAQSKAPSGTRAQGPRYPSNTSNQAVNPLNSHISTSRPASTHNLMSHAQMVALNKSAEELEKNVKETKNVLCALSFCSTARPKGRPKNSKATTRLELVKVVNEAITPQSTNASEPVPQPSTTPFLGAQLPIGLRKVAPSQGTAALTRQIAPQYNSRTRASVISNASSVQSTEKGLNTSELPTVLKKVVPPQSSGGASFLSVSQPTKHMAGNELPLGQVGSSQVRPGGRPFTHRAPRPGTLSSFSVVASRMSGRVSKGDGNTTTPLTTENNNRLSSIAGLRWVDQAGISGSSILQTPHRGSSLKPQSGGKGTRRENVVGRAATGGPSAWNSGMVRHHTPSRRRARHPTPTKQITEVVVISDSDEDFEISFSAEARSSKSKQNQASAKQKTGMTRSPQASQVCAVPSSTKRSMSAASRAEAVDVEMTPLDRNSPVQFGGVRVGSNPNAATKSSQEFERLLRILQAKTQIPDVQFLADALVASGGDLNQAITFIYTRVSC